MAKKLVLYSNDDIIEIYGGPKGFLEAWGEHGELEGLTEEEIQEIAEEYLEANYEVIEDILWYDCKRELEAKNGRVVVGGYQKHHYAGYLPHYVNADFYILEDNALEAVYDENADFITIYQEGEALKVEITTHDYTHIKEIKLLTDEGIKFIRDLSEEYLYPGFEDLEMLFNDSEYSKDFFDEGRAFLAEAKELEDEDEDLPEEELVEVPEDQWGEDYEIDYESFIDVNEQQETLSFIETGYLLDLKDPENFSNLKIIPDEMKRFDRLHAYGTRDQWSYNDTEEAIADAKQIVNELEPYEYIVVSVFPSSKLRKDTSRRYIAPKAFEVGGIKFKYPYMADYSNKDKVTFYDIGDIPRRQKRVQYIIYSCMNDGQGNIIENFIYKQRQYKSRQLRNQ